MSRCCGRQTWNEPPLLLLLSEAARMGSDHEETRSSQVMRTWMRTQTTAISGQQRSRTTSSRRGVGRDAEGNSGAARSATAATATVGASGSVGPSAFSCAVVVTVVVVFPRRVAPPPPLLSALPLATPRRGALTGRVTAATALPLTSAPLACCLLSTCRLRGYRRGCLSLCRSNASLAPLAFGAGSAAGPG